MCDDSHSSLCAPKTVPARFLCPRDFSGKNTGVGCPFFFQGILPRDGTTSSWVSCISRLILYLGATWEAPPMVNITELFGTHMLYCYESSEKHNQEDICIFRKFRFMELASTIVWSGKFRIYREGWQSGNLYMSWHCSVEFQIYRLKTQVGFLCCGLQAEFAFYLGNLSLS